MKKTLKILITSLLFFFATPMVSSYANPIISGISANEINIDTKFQGTKILLFGAKGDAGNIIIAVRGPKKNFMVTKKEKFLGVWYNGERLKFKDSYSFYSLFSTFTDQSSNQDAVDGLLNDLELGKDNLTFNISGDAGEKKQNEFQLQLIDNLEKNKLYALNNDKVEFLDETLFKVSLNFPKNISRGIYTVEIYLVNEGRLLSFQSIPIYVNQVGLSAKILDFASQESFLYGLLAVGIALIVGWLANYLFLKFIGK